MRRNQPQTNCRSSTLDSDEGCKAAGCTQKSLPCGLSQDKRYATKREVSWPCSNHGCSLGNTTGIFPKGQKSLRSTWKKQKQLVRGTLERSCRGSKDHYTLTQPAWCESRGVKWSIRLEDFFNLENFRTTTLHSIFSVEYSSVILD